MLTFLTGIGFGIAAGWFTYIHREWLIMLLLINGGSAATFLFYTVVLPSSSAAGSMHMNLWQFTLYVIEQVSNDYLTNLLLWFNVGFVAATIVTWIAYNGFEPEPKFEVPESREERRRKVEAEMKYQDSYFD